MGVITPRIVSWTGSGSRSWPSGPTCRSTRSASTKSAGSLPAARPRRPGRLVRARAPRAPGAHPRPPGPGTDARADRARAQRRPRRHRRAARGRGGRRRSARGVPHARRARGSAPACRTRCSRPSHARGCSCRTRTTAPSATPPPTSTSCSAGLVPSRTGLPAPRPARARARAQRDDARDRGAGRRAVRPPRAPTAAARPTSPTTRRRERLVDTFRALLPTVTALVAHHFRLVLLEVAQEHLESVGEEPELAAVSMAAASRLESRNFAGVTEVIADPSRSRRRGAEGRWSKRCSITSRRATTPSIGCSPSAWTSRGDTLPSGHSTSLRCPRARSGLRHRRPLPTARAPGLRRGRRSTSSRACSAPRARAPRSVRTDGALLRFADGTLDGLACGSPCATSSLSPWCSPRAAYCGAGGRVALLDVSDARAARPERRSLRIGAFEDPPRSPGPARRSGRRVPRHEPSPGDGPLGGSAGARGPHRALRPSRRLRGPARQRRHHHVLGRRRVRAHRAAERAPRVRRVLVEVRRSHARGAPSRRPGGDRVRARHASRTCGGRDRRRVRAHAQRDVDRCRDGDPSTRHRAPRR